MRRVVVTGMGMVTPLATGVDATWEALLEGRSGIGAITGFDASDLPSRIAGELPRGDAPGAFDADQVWHPKEQRKNDPFITYAMGAAKEAIAASGWQPTEEEDLYRTGVMIGSGI